CFRRRPWPDRSHIGEGRQRADGSYGGRLTSRKTTCAETIDSASPVWLSSRCLAIASLKPADATVRCQGNFQITKYGPIATPYCEEEQIALVAQSYGWHVSTSEIHNNPLKKIEVCTALAGDTRLKGSCPVRARRGG